LHSKRKDIHYEGEPTHSKLKFDTLSTGPTLDLNMFLNASQDRVKSNYPLGLRQFVDCDTNIPADEVIPDLADGPFYIYWGFPWDVNSTCGGNSRQLMFNDRLAHDEHDVNENTPRATFWGVNPGNWSVGNMTAYAVGVPPRRPQHKNGKPAVIWLNGLAGADFFYQNFLDKIAASRDWHTRAVAFNPGDFVWLPGSAPTGASWGTVPLIEKYRCHDADRAIQLLIRQNRDPDHEYYKMIDESKIYLWGHSDGAIASFECWKGTSTPTFDIAPVANVAGALPPMDPGFWQYGYDDIHARFGNEKIAILDSQGSVAFQDFYRIHWANQNQLLNNHLILQRTIHQHFLGTVCQLNPVAFSTGYAARAEFFSIPGVSGWFLCAAPPFDNFQGPLLPKMPMQEASNIIYDWVDRFAEGVESNDDDKWTTSFSTAEIKHWQQHDLAPNSVWPYGRWHCGNVSMGTEPGNDLELLRGNNGYFSSYEQFDGTFQHSSPSDVLIWARPCTSIVPLHFGQPAICLVDPTWDDLVNNEACGCRHNPLC
jgi:hypothetical protein